MVYAKVLLINQSGGSREGCNFELGRAAGKGRNSKPNRKYSVSSYFIIHFIIVGRGGGIHDTNNFTADNYIVMMRI